MILAKECFKCRETKPISAFYKHKEMLDGHVNKCKECNKLDVRKNYQANIKHFKEYELGRALLPHRIMARREYAESKAGKVAHKRANDWWCKRNPIKRAASVAVNNALRGGRLRKPNKCSECGGVDRGVYGHHDDYSKPLEVRWLCSKCHYKWHKRYGQGINGV